MGPGQRPLLNHTTTLIEPVEYPPWIPHSRGKTVGRQVRDEIMGITIPRAGPDVTPTVSFSFGVALTIPCLEFKPEDLIMTADKLCSRHLLKTYVT